MLKSLQGLRFGGAVRRDLAAYSISVPLASLHRPGRLCWSWFVDWHSYRPGGCGHSLFRVVRLPGHQSRTIIDLLGLGSLQFVRQHETA
jgi:hypothetical protein